MRRNNKGRFAHGLAFHLYPLILLIITVLITAFVQWLYKDQTLLSPFVSHYTVGAYESVEIGTTYNPAPLPLKQETKTAKITAYSCGGIKTKAERLMNCPNGITATGTVPTPNRTLACDKANIGRKFKIEGLEGVYVCEDRGGMIVGSGRFDLYVGTIQEAYQWGVKYLKYEEVK